MRRRTTRTRSNSLSFASRLLTQKHSHPAFCRVFCISQRCAGDTHMRNEEPSACARRSRAETFLRESIKEASLGEPNNSSEFKCTPSPLPQTDLMRPLMPFQETVCAPGVSPGACLMIFLPKERNFYANVEYAILYYSATILPYFRFYVAPHQHSAITRGGTVS